MPGSHSDGQPIAGLYEQLITEQWSERLTSLDGQGWKSVEDTVGDESTPHVLSRHIARVVEDVLRSTPAGDRVAVANRVLRSVRPDSCEADPADVVDVIAEGPRQLLALAQPEAPGVYRLRPATPLSETALITNAPEDPNLGYELRSEVATSDGIDLLCAFVKWHGLRVLEKALREARERDVPIRVLTTTYMGATERRALDRLVREFGAEVKVNYELRSTRLHAKAWLFRRKTGYDTAYVGSSNLSKSALVEGLEWNVRLSAMATPAVLTKFEATFDAYWSSLNFEPYDPDRDADRLDEALRMAGRSTGGGSSVITMAALDIRPFPHQRDMLERLDAERALHDRHRNLLVAATGTGKTIMAALDYKALRQKAGRDLRLLFVAHRKEILDQSLARYRQVLNNAEFGELFYGGTIPKAWRHVFASVQSLNGSTLNELAAEHFDVIVIDEFHHGTAPTYRRIMEHFTPGELLGLTATPERTDGVTIQDAYFDGRIAAEMRLWEALENDLLSPFHYFGITDSTDMSAVAWRGGGYASDELGTLLTSDNTRARLVIKAVEEKIADPHAMRALGFCVTVRHAEHMAEAFRLAGLKAVALSGESPKDERATALRDLVAGRIQIIFSVDLFNEGLDIPEVDTLLLLRPTSSATVFLQQLGRGLRRTEDKAVLTVLDFIGQHRKEFRFEAQFRALTNMTRKRLIDGLERDFPQLPSGCQIILEPKAKEMVIGNIREQININVTSLTREVKSYAASRLADYLHSSGREARELYRNHNSWTSLLRRADILPATGPEEEEHLLRRMAAFLHVDDPERVTAYTALLADDAPGYDELDVVAQAYARMLFYSLWPRGGDFPTFAAGLRSLRGLPELRNEVRQLLAHNKEQADYVPIALTGPHADLPLVTHGWYSREEILPALGEATFGGQKPGTFNEGVRWCKGINTDALLVTIEKDEKDFSPQTRYKDYALTDTLFHWESQGKISKTSPTGRRYVNHEERGSHVLLFIRRYKTNDIGRAQPWMLAGPARYKSDDDRSNPMGIVWELAHPLPADVYSSSAIAAP